MLSLVPVKKLSTQRTSQPCSSRRSHRCEPMKPAPPVTRTRRRVAYWRELAVMGATLPNRGYGITGRGLPARRIERIALEADALHRRPVDPDRRLPPRTGARQAGDDVRSHEN